MNCANTSSTTKRTNLVSIVSDLRKPVFDLWKIIHRLREIRTSAATESALMVMVRAFPKMPGESEHVKPKSRTLTLISNRSL